MTADATRITVAQIEEALRRRGFQMDEDALALPEWIVVAFCGVARDHFG